MAGKNPFSAIEAAANLRQRRGRIDSAVESAQARPPRSEADASRARRVRAPAKKLSSPDMRLVHEAMEVTERMKRAQSNPGN